MKAVGYQKSLPVEDANSLIDFETAKPEPKGRDIRVAVKAISANPVDYKVRKRAAPPAGEYKILGFDAAGVVDAVGSDVSLFKPGDEVFYAGSILRQGTNSEFHLVDERIVGNKPKSLSFAQATALPLTSITAWELLFDRLGAVPGKSLDPRTLLITGGAGGVGSILIQLARRLTGLTVVATATRPESQKWCLDLGAHAVIDHGKPMKEQIEALKLPPVGLVASLTFTDQHYKAIAELMAPQGKFGLIDDPPGIHGFRVQGQGDLGALGIDVHALVVPDTRHDRAASSAQRRRRSHRQGRAAHDARPDLWHDQRGEFETRACAAGKRQVARQDRAGGVVAPLSRSLRAKRSNPSRRLWSYGLLRRFAPRNDVLRAERGTRATSPRPPPASPSSRIFRRAAKLLLR
jgi:zinc-binding alcohol dehydrogenase family protein